MRHNETDISYAVILLYRFSSERTTFFSYFLKSCGDFMAVAGIIAEFDPFHLGHQKLIDEAKRALGADTPVVVAMSASFTQRGGAAVCSPAARAEMALRGGASLVLELPVHFSTASAEKFAQGGVQTLAATGVVDTLCFGSETGDLTRLRWLALAIDTPYFKMCLKDFLGQGLPFATARQKALEQVMGPDVTVPEGANDLLATEYLRFLPDGMDALAVKRTDDGHGGAQSATRVRELLRAGEWEAACALLPEYSGEILRREHKWGRCPGSLDWAERAVLYKLRTMQRQDFGAIADCTEGLDQRFVAAAGTSSTLAQLYAGVKTKRFAHARIRRIALRAFLGITQLPDQVPYLRLLGADEKGLALLKQMKKTATLPVITKPAHGHNLPPKARQVYLAARNADDLWGLCVEKVRYTGECWQNTPVILRQRKTVDRV